MALMLSAQGQPILVGRLSKTIEAGELLAIVVDEHGRPIIRRADDGEIGLVELESHAWGSDARSE